MSNIEQWILEVRTESPVSQSGRLSLSSILQSAMIEATGDIEAEIPLMRVTQEGQIVEPGRLAAGEIHTGSILMRPATSQMKSFTISNGLRPVKRIVTGNEYDDQDRKWPSILIPDPRSSTYQNGLNSIVYGDASFNEKAVDHESSLHHFFRFSGDGPAVAKIVASLPAIGKKRTAGFGWIADNGVSLHKIPNTARGLAGLVGVDGMPERTIPYAVWKKLSETIGGCEANPVREYANIAMPFWTGTPIDCVVPRSDFGHFGLIEKDGMTFPLVTPMLLMKEIGLSDKIEEKEDDFSFEMA